jgi:3-oxoacyl-(acyl-carrier-protein) synthase
MRANPPPRVAITGIGVVTPLGSTHAEYWKRLCAGDTAIGPLDAALTPDGLPRLGATIPETSIKALALSPALRRADKVSRMIAAATRDALADARIAASARDVANIEPTRPGAAGATTAAWHVASDRLGIVVGSSVGNLAETDAHLTRICARGPAAASPLLFPNLVLNAPASYASMETGAVGPNLTVSQLEASGEYAVIAGADLVRNGTADVVVAGGSDEVSAIALHAYAESGALSGRRGEREWSSPYDRARNGVVLGEAAAMLVLEPLDAALSRGATIYAVVERDLLFTVPTPPYAWPLGAADVIRSLRERLPAAADVDLVLGCANSSRHLDRLELEVFGELLGDDAARTWLASIKGAVGESGAAGALTVASAALALHDQAVPPLCNLADPEDGVHFRYAASRATDAPLERVLVHALARGGAGAAIVLGRGGAQQP